MQQICQRVAGLDVHRDNVIARFRTPEPRGGVIFEKGGFTTTTAGLRELEVWLADRQVELVAMEATGVYWKPVLYALASRFVVWLCNARNVRTGGRPPAGVWIADDETHALRRQVARRAHIVRQRTRLKNRVLSILHRNLSPRYPAADLLGHKGRTWLDDQDLPVDERQAVDALLRQLDFHN